MNSVGSLMNENVCSCQVEFGASVDVTEAHKKTLHLTTKVPLYVDYIGRIINRTAQPGITAYREG
jgi:hypothetical protein